jgi:GrpB-like predicted nucleotidyltransferase (UPF0157 family)
MNSKREDELRTVTVGELKPLEGPIVLVDYDPQWPYIFSNEAKRLVNVLGERALSIEHVGSTSVPGLAAKPIIDIALGVNDSADEPAYVPEMEAAGYALRIREPHWFEHRVFKGPVADISLHVFSAGCPEITRMLAFRDRLRANEVDRERYLTVKQSLARCEWKYVQDYADEKSTVIAEILTRGSSTSS